MPTLKSRRVARRQRARPARQPLHGGDQPADRRVGRARLPPQLERRTVARPHAADVQREQRRRERVDERSDVLARRELQIDVEEGGRVERRIGHGHRPGSARRYTTTLVSAAREVGSTATSVSVRPSVERYAR